MIALPEYQIVLSTQDFVGGNIAMSEIPSCLLSLSCLSVLQTHFGKRVRLQTHKKLCWECQRFLRASARRETFTQVDVVDHQCWHIHSRTPLRTHAKTQLPCIYPHGGWAVDKLSWQSPLHLVFPLYPVLFLNSSTSLPSIPCTTAKTLFSTAAPCRPKKSHVTGKRGLSI